MDTPRRQAARATPRSMPACDRHIGSAIAAAAIPPQTSQRGRRAHPHGCRGQKPRHTPYGPRLLGSSATQECVGTSSRAHLPRRPRSPLRISPASSSIPAWARHQRLTLGQAPNHAIVEVPRSSYTTSVLTADHRIALGARTVAEIVQRIVDRPLADTAPADARHLDDT